MISWLAKKALSARASMCTKELQWHLEQSTMHERADILLYSQDYRYQAFSNTNIISRILDAPTSSTYVEVSALYNKIEETRNLHMHYSKMAKKEMKRFGFETHMSIDETESIRRGFELWLVTLASGFDLTFRDRALFVWDTLHASATSFDELLQYRRSTKELNSELGNDTDLKILDLPTALMWEQIAYVPSFIAPLLRKPIIAPTQTP